MRISIVMLIFLLFSDQILGESLRGPSAPSLPVEESQVKRINLHITREKQPRCKTTGL